MIHDKGFSKIHIIMHWKYFLGDNFMRLFDVLGKELDGYLT